MENNFVKIYNTLTGPVFAIALYHGATERCPRREATCHGKGRTEKIYSFFPGDILDIHLYYMPKKKTTKKKAAPKKKTMKKKTTKRKAAPKKKVMKKKAAPKKKRKAAKKKK